MTTSDDESGGFADRDYSTEFPITLEWHEWNRIHSLVFEGIEAKRSDDWPNEDIAKDAEVFRRFNEKLGDASPGNGIRDWPDDMRKAYDQAVTEAFRTLREEQRDPFDE